VPSLPHFSHRATPTDDGLPEGIVAVYGAQQLTSTVVCSPDATPTEVQLPVWTQVEDVLRQTDEILFELSVYRGATLQIRDVSRLYSLCTFSFRI